MSDIFVSYRFTGEDPKELAYQIGGISESLKINGYDVVCSFFLEDYFRQQRFTPDQIYDCMLRKQRKADTFMALVKTKNKSKGMVLEHEQALELGQRYVLLNKKGIQVQPFHNAASQVITFEEFPELFSQLKSFR